MTKYTTLSEELNKLPKERQELIEARASQIRLEEITLRHLREKLGLSQSELAERLEVQQPAISQLERRQNLELNTLRAVVNALGGTIEIIVRVPNKEPIIISDYQEEELVKLWRDRTPPHKQAIAFLPTQKRSPFSRQKSDRTSKSQKELAHSRQKSDRTPVNQTKSDRTQSPIIKAIAYSGRFTIAHLPTKKRSCFRKSKVIAFVQLQRSAIAPQSPIIKAKEWIGQGNKVETFNDCSAKIVIILDNASFHKKRDILEKIEAEMPNILARINRACSTKSLDD